MASRGMSFDRIKEVFDAGKQAEAARKEAVRIAVELSPGAPDSLVFALKDALVPQTAQAMIHVGALASNEPILVNPEADLCIILCGSETSLTRACARGWAKAGVPVCLLAESSLDVPETGISAGVEPACAVATDPNRALALLSQWMVRANEKGPSLAMAFPFCRKAQANSDILSCAAANAGVGAVDFIKGADFPVMCATESSMALRIAALYGYAPGPARTPEIACVVAGGLLMRSVARAATHSFPKISWILKGFIGWGGTYLTGQLLLARYEAGEAFDEKLAWGLERLKEVAYEMGQRARTLTGSLVEVEPGALYSDGSQGSSLARIADVIDVVVAPEPTQWFEIGQEGNA